MRSSVLLALAFFCTALFVKADTGNQAEGPLVHTVFFWLKNPESADDRAQMLAGLKDLASIELIKKSYLGTPAPDRREIVETSYDFSLTFIFESAADELTYQTHPIHNAFVKANKELWEKVVVYDTLPATEE